MCRFGAFLKPTPPPRLPTPRLQVFRGRHRMDGIERGDSLVRMASHERTGHLPLGMIAAVIVDAMTDGLLIGIAQGLPCRAGVSHGFLMWCSGTRIALLCFPCCFVRAHRFIPCVLSVLN